MVAVLAESEAARFARLPELGMGCQFVRFAGRSARPDQRTWRYGLLLNARYAVSWTELNDPEVMAAIVAFDRAISENPKAGAGLAQWPQHTLREEGVGYFSDGFEMLEPQTEVELCEDAKELARRFRTESAVRVRRTTQR